MGAYDLIVKYFKDSLPARAYVGVSNIPKNAKIEIETVTTVG